MRQNNLNLVPGVQGFALGPRGFHGFVTIHDYNPARADKQFG